MPDISMCADEDCPSKLKCYRFMARPDQYRQSYAAFQHDKTGKCKMFWEIGKGDRLRDASKPAPKLHWEPQEQAADRMKNFAEAVPGMKIENPENV